MKIIQGCSCRLVRSECITGAQKGLLYYIEIFLFVNKKQQKLLKYLLTLNQVVAQSSKYVQMNSS